LAFSSWYCYGWSFVVRIAVVTAAVGVTIVIMLTNTCFTVRNIPFIVGHYSANEINNKIWLKL
jgi:hypothetical protein